MGKPCSGTAARPARSRVGPPGARPRCRVVQGDRDDQALALTGHRQPGPGRLPHLGDGVQRGPDLGQQRDRVGGRTADPDLGAVGHHQRRGQVADTFRVDGHAGLRARVQRDADAGRQSAGPGRPRGPRCAAWRDGLAGRGSCCPASPCLAGWPGRASWPSAGRGERRDELGAQIGDGGQHHRRPVGNRPLVGQRKPEPSPAKLVEQVGNPVGIFGGGGQRVLDGSRCRGDGRAGRSRASPRPQAMAPGRMKVPPWDMAEVGVVGFIGVFLSLSGRSPRCEPDSSRRGQATHSTDSKHVRALRNEESCRRRRSLGGGPARTPGVLDRHLRGASRRRRLVSR